MRVACKSRIDCGVGRWFRLVWLGAVRVGHNDDWHIILIGTFRLSVLLTSRASYAAWHAAGLPGLRVRSGVDCNRVANAAIKKWRH